MKISFQYECTLEIDNFNLDHLLAAFKTLLLSLLSSFISQALQQLATSMTEEKTTENVLSCPHCGSQKHKWKTRASSSVSASFITCYGQVNIPQMQVECKKCNKKRYLVRELLEQRPRSRISPSTEQQLALLGALSSYRVCEVSARIFGASFSHATIWRSTQKVGKLMEFSVSEEELGICEADGTGIPIHGAGVRGKELKILIQQNKLETARKTKSNWRLAGIDLGPYNGSWENLFKPSLKAMGSFEKFYLTIDGDQGIKKGLGDAKVKIQRCLWHIPHQLKHNLWQDKIERKSKVWESIMARALELTTIPYLLDKDEISAVLERKEKIFHELLRECEDNGCVACVSYLENARPDLFNAVSNRIVGKTTSHAERVMRTVNLRINYGKWSHNGALNAMKIRLAFYYNGFDPSKGRVIG